MSPRPDVSEQRRGQILEAAAAVFSRLGFSNARMDDIAAQSGLSKGILYWYFKSKDTIISALLEKVFARSLEDLRTAQAAEGPVSDRLIALSRGFAREVHAMSTLLPITFEFYAIATRHKVVKEFLKGSYHDYRVALASLIQKGVDQGEFCQVDTEAAANTIIALYEGLVLLYVVDPAAIDLDWHSEEATRLILRGLRQKDGGS